MITLEEARSADRGRVDARVNRWSATIPTSLLQRTQRPICNGRSPSTAESALARTTGCGPRRHAPATGTASPPDRQPHLLRPPDPPRFAVAFPGSTGTRRGARVAELASPESWCTGNGTVGSNPTPSAGTPLVTPERRRRTDRFWPQQIREPEDPEPEPLFLLR